MNLRVTILAACMLLTGTVNTIANKYQVNSRQPPPVMHLKSFTMCCRMPAPVFWSCRPQGPCIRAIRHWQAKLFSWRNAENRSRAVNGFCLQDLVVIGHKDDGTALTFRHPAVQSAFMFLGEMLCLIPYFYLRYKKKESRARSGTAYVSTLSAEEKQTRNTNRIFAFAVPALCDACGTTLMNVGLYFTYASAFQMLRGTLVLFAGTFTVIILRRSLYSHHWLGMVLITAGAAIVGAASVLHSGSRHSPGLMSLMGKVVGRVTDTGGRYPILVRIGACSMITPQFDGLIQSSCCQLTGCLRCRIVGVVMHAHKIQLPAAWETTLYRST